MVAELHDFSGNDEIDAMLSVEDERDEARREVNKEDREHRRGLARGMGHARRHNQPWAFPFRRRGQKPQ